jgi:hypothetical protein
MDKKTKQRRQKSPTKDELLDTDVPNTPPGASFDTEAGRAAQGMRDDLGGKPDEEVKPPPDRDDDAG